MKKIYLLAAFALSLVTGFAQNPFMLKDVYPGATGSGIQEIVKTSTYAIFNADDDDADTDRGLYRSDGSVTGTIKLNLTYPGYLTFKADKLTAVGDKVFFAGDNMPNYGEIWVTDGTQAGTIALERFQPTLANRTPVLEIAKYGNEAFFSVVDNANHTVLKKTNGTAAGTSVVFDFSTALAGAPDVLFFKELNGILYFIVYDAGGSGSDQLWRTNGTAAGTYLIKDFGTTQYLASNIMVAGNTMYLMFVTPGVGDVLWKSDGTGAGTVAVKTINATASTGLNNYPSFAAINNTLFFSGNDGVNGKELWKTDGTATNTILVANINPGAASSNPTSLINYNGVLYYTADNGTLGKELCRTFATSNSFGIVKDINPGSASSNISNMIISNNTLIFQATTAASGAELWISDGNTNNTLQVADINPSGSSSPTLMTAITNDVYFSATNGVNGREFFQYYNGGGVLTGPSFETIYVNDNSTAGDILTTAVGNDANPGTQYEPVATISKAIAMAQPGYRILIDAGTYTEQLNIDKTLTLKGAGKTKTFLNGPATPLVALPDFGEKSIIQALSGLGDITIEGLSIDGSLSDETHSILIQGGGTVANCEMKNANNGIYFRYPGTTQRFATATNNNIHHISYVGMNFAGSQLYSSANFNSIDLTNALYGMGVIAGFDLGALPQFFFQQNFIIGHNGWGIQAYTATGLVTNNSITGTAGYALAGNGYTAQCNWFGSADKSAVQSKVNGNILYAPWLANGIDAQPATDGFQPSFGTCTGSVGTYYVNDNSTVGDRFTTAVGNDNNNGTKEFPFATLSRAHSVAQNGDSVYVDAGSYPQSAVSFTISKSLVLIGANFDKSPNDPTNKLLANATRNPESVISNATFFINSSNVSFNGFTLNPGPRSVLSLNGLFNNLQLFKNKLLFSSGTAITVFGPTAAIPDSIKSSGHQIVDNRLEKSGDASMIGINLAYVKNLSVSNNAIVRSGTITRGVTAILVGQSGIVDNILADGNVMEGVNYGFFTFLIGKATLTNNSISNYQRGFFVQANIPGSTDITISGNTLSTSATNQNHIMANTFAGNGTGSSAKIKIENNNIQIDGTGLTGLAPAISTQFTSTVLNPELKISGNKITHTGDYSMLTGGPIGISLNGKNANTIISANEIQFAGTGLPVSPNPLFTSAGISLSTDGGANAIPAGAVFSFFNNKISGYKTSLAFIDNNSAGTDSYTGFGNLPSGTSVTITNNSFTNDSLSINNGSIGQVVNATCNWFGTTTTVAAKNSANVTFTPWLVSGSDNSMDVGFQPLNGVCTGPQTNFYVNDNSTTGDVYTTGIGNDNNPGTAAHPFATITKAISIAGNRTAIYVDAGTYAEHVLVDKHLTIRGAKTTAPGLNLDRGAESIIIPPVTDILEGNLFTVRADSVTIEGFTFNGDNPGLSSGNSLNGVDVNIGRGIANGSIPTGWTEIKYLNVQNNIFRNINKNAVLLYSPNFVTLFGNFISNNRIDNICSWATGRAIFLERNAYATITDNYFTRVVVGIQHSQFTEAAPVQPAISNNYVESLLYGIYFLNNSGNAGNFLVETNTVKKYPFSDYTVPNKPASEFNNAGLALLSATGNTTFTINNNNVEGYFNGLVAAQVTTLAPLQVNGGVIRGAATNGVYLTDVFVGNAAGVSSVVLNNVGLIDNATGILVLDNDANPNASALELSFTGTTSITGGVNGLALRGKEAFIKNNTLSIPIGGQSGAHIFLADSALLGQELNATAATFNGVGANTMSSDQLFSLEDKIIHSIDFDMAGFVRVNPRQVYITPSSFAATLPASFGVSTSAPSLSRAISSAVLSDTVRISGGTYDTPDMTLTKSLTFIGPNGAISPNDGSDKALPNTSRVAEAIISGATFTIGASDLQFKGLTFDPGNKQAFVMPNGGTNPDYGNFSFAKNILKITHSTNNLNSFGLNGKIVASPSLPLTSGYTITDNRFEKGNDSTGTTFLFNYIKNISITHNSFVRTGGTARKQQAVNLGASGIVSDFQFTNNRVEDATNAVNGNRIATALVSRNIINNSDRPFNLTGAMAESSHVEFSGNEMENTTGGTPFIGYNRSGTSVAGATTIFKVENNTIKATPQPGNALQLFGSMNFTVTNSILNPSFIIKGNKIDYSGDFSLLNNDFVRPITVRGNLQNVIIEANEVRLSQTLSMLPPAQGSLLPPNPAITINTDFGPGSYMPANAVININNNKIEGFKQSVVFYDAAAAGINPFIGYGNIPQGATVSLINNSFTSDSISINNGNTGGIAQASCNWFGTTSPSAIAAKISEKVSNSTWLIDGTDTSPATGFQPQASSCSGTPFYVSITDSSQVTCNGLADGTATVTVGGGLAPITISWTKEGDASYSANTAAISGLAAGTYVVTATDSDGALLRDTVVITEPELLRGTISSTDITCHDAANGKIIPQITGGTLPYTFQWSNGSTADSLVNLGAGTYEVLITDASGCTFALQGIVITEPDALEIIEVEKMDVSCNGAADGSIGVIMAGGTGQYTYLWNTGATEAVIYDLAPGTYSVTITDENGCSISDSFTIATPDVLVATATGTPVSTFGAADGTLTLTIAGGTYPYDIVWSNGATDSLLTGLSAGIYTATITDYNGCSDTAAFTIEQPISYTIDVSATSVSCFGGNNGSASVTTTGGTAPFNYAWSNGATTQTATNLTAGTYTVTVTDANGYSVSGSVTVTEPTTPVSIDAISATPVSCFGGTNGTASVSAAGGTGGYTYLWSTGATTATISGVAAGNYSVTITDANGCTIASQIEVVQPTLLTVIASGTNVLCNGGTEGSASATVSGGTAPYTYAWSNGATSSSISGLPIGTYTVTVTDENGCTVTGSYTVTQPAPVNPTIDVVNVSCFGAANGSITVTGRGGTAPYQYSFNGGSYGTQNAWTNQSPGTYTVLVKDANNCVFTTAVTITQPNALVQTEVVTPTCAGTNGGAINITVSGGTPRYSFSWSGPGGFASTREDITGLAVGTYNLTITDDNGCVITNQITVAALPGIAVTGQVITVACFGGLTGGVDITVNPTGTYTYVWSGPNGYRATTEDISGVKAGTYSVVVTSANGCTQSATFVVTQPAAALTVTTTKSDISSCGGTGSITATANGGTAPYEYRLNSGAFQTGNVFSGLSVGSYTITARDSRGCTVTSSTVSIVDNGMDPYEANERQTAAVLVTPNNVYTARIAPTANDKDWFKFTTGATTVTYTLSLSHASVAYLFDVYDSRGRIITPTSSTTGLNATKTYAALLPNTVYSIQVRGNLSYNCYQMQLSNGGAITKAQSSEGTTEIVSDKKEVASMELAVVAFPNPSEGQFQVRITTSSSLPVQVRVMNNFGQVVEVRQNASAKSILNLGDTYRPGIYYLEVVQGGNRKSLKLIKQ